MAEALPHLHWICEAVLLFPCRQLADNRQNQYVVLIMNLLIADLQQGLSFLISFYWVDINAILAPTRACFAQGWLLQIGDVSSGFFVCFIAFHTFYCAVKGQRFSTTAFYLLIIATWVFSLVLTALGPLMYRDKYFVRAGAWCWASSNYERERLALHYIWVFMVQFGTIIIYALVLLHLKKTMSIIMPTAAQTDTLAKIDRAAKLMVLYPAVYIVLTLPLSAGRMWSMANGGANLPDSYSLLAGTLIASTGFVDSLLYTLTRKQLISGSSPERTVTQTRKDSQGWFKRSGNTASADRSNHSRLGDLTWSGPEFNGGITQTRTVTITGRRASATTDEGPTYEMDERGRGLPRAVSRTQNPLSSRSHSPTESLEPIMQSNGQYSLNRGQTQGYGSDKNHVTEVSVSQLRSNSTDSSIVEDSDSVPGSPKEVKGLKTFYTK